MNHDDKQVDLNSAATRGCDAYDSNLRVLSTAKWEMPSIVMVRVCWLANCVPTGAYLPVNYIPLSPGKS